MRRPICPHGRPDPALIDALRARIQRLERHAPDQPGILSLGAPAIDRALPWGGLPRAALHEVGADDPAAAGFCAALLARLAGQRGTVLWCRRGRDLYGPGLAALGLDPGRLIVVRGRHDTDILWAMEEGLRGGSVAAVLGEVPAIAPVAARRLQLAAEKGGGTALLLRPASGKAFADATPATTRWRVASAPRRADAETAFPAALANTPGAAWRVALVRCRGGAAGGTWIVECDNEERDDGTTGGFVVVAEVRDRPAAAGRRGEWSTGRRRRAAG